MTVLYNKVLDLTDNELLNVSTAKTLDSEDQLSNLRDEFAIPTRENVGTEKTIYGKYK